MGKLNPKQVENLTAPGTYEDGDGLRLVVKPSGRRSWILRYQLNQRRREMGLGAYPLVSLKEARIAATEQRKLLIKGIDPVSAREADRRQRREVQRLAESRRTTFEELARDYWQTHSAGWSPKWRAGWLSKLERYAFPVLGRTPTADIGVEHVLRVLRPIWGEKTRTADEVRGQIERILDSANVLQLRDGSNPARWKGCLDNLLGRAEKQQARQRVHYPAMPWRDVPALMARLEGIQTQAAYAARLLILTAARWHMVRGATWREFDLTAGIWSLPADRMKARQAFDLPLSPEVVSLLGEIPRIGDSPYLFPGQGRTGLTHNNAIRNLLHQLGHADVTPHGFRSSFRDWSSERTSYPRQICELALAHDERGQTEAAYSRSSMLEKRRALMADWAAFVGGAHEKN